MNYDTALKSYAVSNLPNNITGMEAFVIDGAPGLGWGDRVTSGGTTIYKVWYNGKMWTVTGKINMAAPVIPRSRSEPSHELNRDRDYSSLTPARKIRKSSPPPISGYSSATSAARLERLEPPGTPATQALPASPSMERPAQREPAEQPAIPAAPAPAEPPATRAILEPQVRQGRRSGTQVRQPRPERLEPQEQLARPA